MPRLGNSGRRLARRPAARARHHGSAPLGPAKRGLCGNQTKKERSWVIRLLYIISVLMMVGSNGPRKQHELFIISRNLPIHSLFQGIDEVLTAIKVLVILPAFKLQSTSAKPTSSTWQGHMPNILQQHHVSGSLLPSNASPFPSSTIEFSGSSPRTAQSAAVHALREEQQCMLFEKHGEVPILLSFQV